VVGVVAVRQGLEGGERRLYRLLHPTGRQSHRMTMAAPSDQKWPVTSPTAVRIPLP